MIPLIDVGQAVREAERRLNAIGIDTARLDAVLLVAHAAGLTPDAIRTNPARSLALDAEGRLMTLMRKRAEDRMPVSRLVGEREFWSLPFKLSPATLDPRAGSEALVEAVVRHTQQRGASLCLFDLGVGTGCLLLSLLTEFPAATGLGIDVSPEAANAARENAACLDLTSRAEFQVSNGFSGIEGTFDWIVSNPPYIPSSDIETLAPEVRDHDPHVALDGGPDGLEVIRSILPESRIRLKPAGRIAMEFGDDQAEAVKELFAANGLACLEIVKDLGGRERVIVARPE